MGKTATWVNMVFAMVFVTIMMLFAVAPAFAEEMTEPVSTSDETSAISDEAAITPSSEKEKPSESSSEGTSTTPKSVPADTDNAAGAVDSAASNEGESSRTPLIEKDSPKAPVDIEEATPAVADNPAADARGRGLADSAESSERTLDAKLDISDAARSSATQDTSASKMKAVSASLAPARSSAETVTMFRLYNPNSGEHFYTSSSYERSYCIYSGWCNEGVGWVAPAFSNSPVYRMYNPNAGDHHYTLSAYERDQLVRAGWIYEHIGWYSDDGKAIPVYRQYNPNASVGTHNFTTSKVENDSLVAVGWNAEGIGWYAVALGESVSPVEVNKVYLDAGHGMNNRKPGVWDSGAEGNGYYEANLTIQLVEKVASYARSTYGLDVYTNSNKGVSLWNRQSDAVNHNCTSLVSIHFNAGGGTGSESYSRESGAHVRSAGLQSIMHEQLVAGMGIADRGEKTDDLVVLRGLPSTLLEICFIDNAKDMDKYNANFDKLARKLAYGLFQAVHANY